MPTTNSDIRAAKVTNLIWGAGREIEMVITGFL
jgi:hypothetical protein